MYPTPHRTGSRPKSPMVHRILCSCALLALGSPAMAQAPAWTVEEAISSALDNPAIAQLQDARLQTARAQVDAEIVAPTPSLGLAHEQVFGGVDVAYLEFSAMLQQELDLSGRRGRLREARSHREQAAQAESDAARLEVISAVTAAFYEVRHRQERLTVIEAWCSRLEAGLEAMEARQARGDTSAYDTLRIERELEIARASRAVEVAALEEAWGRLETWTAWEERPALEGTLVPDPMPAEGLARWPELERLGAMELALDAEVQAWDGAFWRAWTLGAGYRYAEVNDQTGHGVLLSLSIPLTLWNPDAPRADHARGEKSLIGADLQLAQTRLQRARQASLRRLAQTREALDAMRDPERDAELTRLAEVAFAAGETTLVELLDTYESEAELALGRLDLQWEVRRASIEFDRLRGAGLPQQPPSDGEPQ